MQWNCWPNIIFHYAIIDRFIVYCIADLDYQYKNVNQSDGVCVDRTYDYKITWFGYHVQSMSRVEDARTLCTGLIVSIYPYCYI